MEKLHLPIIVSREILIIFYAGSGGCERLLPSVSRETNTCVLRPLRYAESGFAGSRFIGSDSNRYPVYMFHVKQLLKAARR